MNEQITINSRKFDGKIHRSWKCKLVERKDSLLVFVGEFEEEVSHPKLGLIRRGTVSYEYYWLDRWFNIFRFHEPDGRLRNFYCNINAPPEFDGTTLHFIDLDVDILVSPNMSFQVLDEDEFNVNALRFNYSDLLTVCCIFWPCSSMPVINNTSLPSNRAKRAITSVAIRS